MEEGIDKELTEEYTIEGDKNNDSDRE